MKTKVNFRITKDGEIIAVFIEKLMNGKENVNQQKGIIQVNYSPI